ncbi:MAG: hypothetical protein WDN10_01020 [bacterium]
MTAREYVRNHHVWVIGLAVFLIITAGVFAAWEYRSAKIPADWQAYVNAVHGYEVSHPADMDVSYIALVETIPVEESDEAVMSFPGVGHPIIFWISAELPFTNEIPEANKTQADRVALPLREFAETIREDQVNDGDGAAFGKRVGDLVETTFAGRQAYSFTLTKSFLGVGEGYMLEPEGAVHRFIFVENDIGTKLMIHYPLGNAVAEKMAESFRFVPGATVSREALAPLQNDLKGVVPHFIAGKGFADVRLTPQEEKIKSDIVALFVSREPDNAEYYSRLRLRAIGTRYVLVSQPSAESSYDLIIDSATGHATSIPNGANYRPIYPPLEEARPADAAQMAVYIGSQDVYTYSLDRGSFSSVFRAKLYGSETYHSGRADAYLDPEETHTDNSITLTVFDSSRIVRNPEAPENAMQTMYKRIRQVTLSLP